MHSSQIYTPGPATSLFAMVFGLRQNEHEAIHAFLQLRSWSLPVGVRSSLTLSGVACQYLEATEWVMGPTKRVGPIVSSCV